MAAGYSRSCSAVAGDRYPCRRRARVKVGRLVGGWLCDRMDRKAPDTAADTIELLAKLACAGGAGYDVPVILRCFMNRQPEDKACADTHAAVRVRAVLVAAVLSAGMFSCLPNSDLSSYSNGPRASQPDGVSPDGIPLDGVPTETAPTDPAAGTVGSASAEGAPGSDCAGECPMPALMASATEGSAAEGGAQSGVAQQEGVPNEGDAGAPTEAPAADAGVARCVSGAALAPSQRCFTLVSEASTWQEARTRCQGVGTGWDLATIRDAEQNTWLAALLGTVTDAWVGASDLQSEGAWRWLDDSAAFWNGPGSTGSRVGNAYVNWNGGGPTPEPNGGEASDCLRLRTGGGWADLQCATAFASICEGPQL